MPIVNLTCPHCAVLLRLSDPPATGKAITCPKCGADFVPGTPAPRRAAIDDAEDEDDRRPRRRSRTKQPQLNPAVLAAVVVLCLIMIRAGITIGFMNWSTDTKPTVVVDPNARPGPTNPFQPGNPPNRGGGNPPQERQSAGPQVGQEAPEIVGSDIDEKPFKLSDYRGKVVVLDFWGHW